MTLSYINTGTPNSGNGDSLRTSFNIVNANFRYISSSNFSTGNLKITNQTILGTQTNHDILILPNGTGSVVVPSLTTPSLRISESNTSTTAYVGFVYYQRPWASNLTTGTYLSTGTFGMPYAIPAPYLVISVTGTNSVINQITAGDFSSGADSKTYPVLARGTGGYQNYIALDVTEYQSGEEQSLVGTEIHVTRNLNRDFTKFVASTGSGIILDCSNTELHVYGSIVPFEDSPFQSLGMPTRRWSDIWLGAGGINIEDEANKRDIKLSVNNGNLKLGQTGISVGSLIIHNDYISATTATKFFVGTSTHILSIDSNGIELILPGSSVIFSDGTMQTTAYTGTQNSYIPTTITDWTGSPTVATFTAGLDELASRTSLIEDTKDRITTGSYSVVLGADGRTTFPNSVFIDAYYGTHFPRIVADTGKAFSIQGQGSTGSAALAWFETESTSSQYAAVGVSKGGGQDLANVVLTAGASTPTLKVWRFDETGALTLPQGSILSETTDTIVITPPTANAGQSLVVRPTGAQGIVSDHPGGFTDGDTITLTVTPDYSFNPVTGTVDYTFTNCTQQQLGRALTGTLTFTNESYKEITWTIPVSSTITIFTITLSNASGFSLGGLISPLTLTRTGSSEAYHVHLVAGDPTAVDLYLGDDDQYVKIEKNAGNVVVGTDNNNYHWTFGTDGLLTLPDGNTRIGNVFGSDAIVGSTDTSVSVFTQGPSGSAVLQWIDNIENIGTTSTQVAAVFLNSPFGSSTGTVQIATGELGAPLPEHIWEFGTDGNTTLPGDITGNNFIGNGSQLTGISYANISNTPSMISPSYELHVAKNGNDTTGNGDILNPYLTIGQALTMAADSYKIIVHAGDYNENIVINNLNFITIASVDSGGISAFTPAILGNLTVSGTSTSIAIKNVGVNGTITHSASGSLYLTDLTLGQSTNIGTLNKTGSGYLSVQNCNLSVTSGANLTNVSITGSGTVVFNNTQLAAVTVNNTSASISIVNNSYTLSVTLTAGTLNVFDSYMYTLGNSGFNAVNATGGVLQIRNSILVNPNQTPAKVNLASPTVFAYDDIYFDRAGSTLGISANATVDFQSVRLSDTLSVTGNISGNKFVGDGSSLTNVTISQVGNILGSGTNVTLVAGSYSYVFDNTGTFTMPDNSNLVIPGANANLTVDGTALLGGASQVIGYYSALGVKYAGGGTQHGMTLQPTNDNTTVINFLNATGTNIGAITQTTSTVKFVGDGSGLTNLTGVATRTTGTWTVAAGAGTYSITVPINGAYQMWVRCNIPNGIITYQATVHVSNTNVPVLGSQQAWNYTGGGSPILLTSIPNQIVGVEGTISTATLITTTANRFDFGINNTSGSSQIVYWGYITL